MLCDICLPSFKIQSSSEEKVIDETPQLFWKNFFCYDYEKYNFNF